MDITTDIANIRCPTLGVAGIHDTFRSEEYVRRIMAPIPGVEFIAIETCHHQPAASPEAITAILRDFMKQYRAPA